VSCSWTVGGLLRHNLPRVTGAGDPDGVHEFVKIGLRQGRSFWLALPEEKGPYTTELAAAIARNSDYFRQPHLGLLVLDLLGGHGTLIDVGANIGTVALPAAVCGSNVVAIEPLPENALCLSAAVLKNRLGNLLPLAIAAGEMPRVIGLVGTEAWARVTQPGEGTRVMMLPLDDIVDLVERQDEGRRRRFLRKPLVVKIDAEGYELPILQGTRQLIARRQPDLVIECAMIEGLDHPISRQTDALKQLLEASGYHFYQHCGNRLAPRRAADLQEGHLCDFLASRRAYRPGDRIGRFTVGELSFAERLRWVGEIARHPHDKHRLHATGIIARWLGEGHTDPELSRLGRTLLDDDDSAVAVNAARLLEAALAR
jgi:FkbM family methyltransferase